MPKKLKLLCMHGFGTNKDFMQMQAKSIQNQLRQIAEFIYIDGPIVVPKDLVFDSTVFKHLKGDTRSWLSQKLSSDFVKVGKTSPLPEVLSNLQEIRIAIENVSKDYDGVLSFSQGSMVFQIISLYHKLGHIKWQSFKNIKFFINFSSVAVKYSLSILDWQRFSVPSIHILSSSDVFFQTQMVTLTRFDNPEYIFHDFGHKFPFLGVDQKKKLINFMKKYGFAENREQMPLRSKL